MPAKRSYVVYPTAGHEFAANDRVLDRSATGQRWLKNPQIADLVAEAILAGTNQRRFYNLAAWVIMPNHVHILIQPTVRVAVLMSWLKGSTARRANQILNRTCQPFWQQESWDHYLRRATQIDRITDYIECNPVSAGLVATPEDWRWSSVRQAKAPTLPNPQEYVRAYPTQLP
jgi:REP element-mobilizing transposase RayT